jgi:hypothetical protein
MTSKYAELEVLLHRYYNYEEYVKNLIKMMEQNMELKEVVLKASRLTGMPNGSGTSDRTANSAVKNVDFYDERIREYQAELEYASRMQSIIMEAMHTLDMTDEEQEILKRRCEYRPKEKWDSIAIEIGSSVDTVKKVYTRCIGKLLEVIGV